MTCRYTQTKWRDALYNAVRNAPGGVEAAAAFLADRRGTRITPESLRKKLRGLELLDVDMAIMLTEWLEEQVTSAASARDWLLCLCAQEGLHVDDVPPAPEGGWKDEAKALNDKTLSITERLGRIAGVTIATTADGLVEQSEADALIPLIRETRVLLHRMERNILRAVEKHGGDRP